MREFVAAVCLAAAMCAPAAEPAQRAEAAPAKEPCPANVPVDAQCLRGQDSRGGHYIIVVPAKWNGVLVVHAHGGPPLVAKRSRADEDAARWNVFVRAGYAWAAPVYHEGGVAVRSAAEDVERVRAIFVAHVAKPRRTILHGNSWGASVAAKAGEMYAAPGTASPYDAILLTSGVLGGGTRSYDFRLDLRAVYQYYCRNHPRPGEPQYPLWIGLPAESNLERADLAARVEECLGKAGARTPQQAALTRTLADVIRIPESSILSHLAWGTFEFRDIAKRVPGNVFGNVGAEYRGSPDDAALNAGVARYAADAAAVARFAADADLTGRVGIPMLSLHAIDDPTAFVELEHAFRDTVAKAGASDRLVQTFGDYAAHSFLAAPDYIAETEALLAWVESGEKPTARSVAGRCKSLEPSYGPGCRFVVDYEAQPLDTRVAPRQRPQKEVAGPGR
jgi:hypothetical protein